MLTERALGIGIAFLILSGSAASAACTALPYTFTNGTTADATQVNANFTAAMNCATTPLPVPTRQVLTSGTSATYTTPSNVRQLRIRMVGGGGGGGAGGDSATDGGIGNNTIFNGVAAAGGGAGSNGTNGNSGIGGAGGTGTASLRMRGQSSNSGPVAKGWAGSAGAPGPWGGGGNTRNSDGVASAGSTNSGAGGGGGLSSSSSSTAGGGSGGGAGEYVELTINSPAATYTYTVGTSGAGGTTSANGTAGAAGGSGIIIVDEFY